AAIIAGLMAARALVPGAADLLDDPDLLRLATELEGHPDNVAACLYGGLTIALTAHGGALAAPLPPPPALRPVVFVSPPRASTAKARKLLPAEVPHTDAVRTAGRAALLVHALTREPDLLLPGTEDWLHQGYRAPAMPKTAGLIRTLRESGVPAVVSGAGPSVLAFGPGGVDLSQHAPRGWEAQQPPVDLAGAQVLPLGG